MQGALASPPYQTSMVATFGPRGGTRTQLVVVSSWTAAVTAMAILLYPPLAAALFALLVGLVIATGLRRRSRGALPLAVLAAAAFTLADLAVSVVTSDPAASRLGPIGLLSHPAAHQVSVLASLVLGTLVLVVSAALASGLSRAVGRPSDVVVAPPSRGRAAAERPPSGRAAVRDLDVGLRQAEVEVARATEYRREVTLALVGIDPPAEGGDTRSEHERLHAMRFLDDLILANVTRFVAVVAYGPNERLMVLPEESADSLTGAAGQLCDLATEYLTRQVRAALVSYPAHGRSLPGLLSSLEIDLAACRANQVVVTVGGAPVSAVASSDPAPAQELGPAEQEPQALPLGFSDEMEQGVEPGQAPGRDLAPSEDAGIEEEVVTAVEEDVAASAGAEYARPA
jgi:hypothetical protein